MSTSIVVVVAACMRHDGLPTFALTEVEVTQEEADNGRHYDMAEERLMQNGYEEPFVHFADNEAPTFLTAARPLLERCGPKTNQILLETT